MIVCADSKKDYEIKRNESCNIEKESLHELLDLCDVCTGKELSVAYPSEDLRTCTAKFPGL